MIRRSKTATGEEQWVLISQVEHARLSGALAGPWGKEPFARLAPREGIVAAVAHHDDGWAAWEIAPKVDAQTGRPLDFTETALTDSLAIWRESIRAAAGIGPLAGYMVSGHFTRLLERFSGRWKSDATATALANDFLTEQQAERDKWLAMWQKTAGDSADRAAADRAVSWLQMFDALSLWLCCAERREPQEFAPPGGPVLTLRPTTGPYAISVSPWPFLTDELEVAALGRAIAVRPYADPSDVVTAAAQPVTLNWSLRRAESTSPRHDEARPAC